MSILGIILEHLAKQNQPKGPASSVFLDQLVVNPQERKTASQVAMEEQLRRERDYRFNMQTDHPSSIKREAELGPVIEGKVVTDSSEETGLVISS